MFGLGQGLNRRKQFSDKAGRECEEEKKRSGFYGTENFGRTFA